jgi:hypothetical protein
MKWLYCAVEPEHIELSSEYYTAVLAGDREGRGGRREWGLEWEKGVVHLLQIPIQFEHCGAVLQSPPPPPPLAL